MPSRVWRMGVWHRCPHYSHSTMRETWISWLAPQDVVSHRTDMVRRAAEAALSTAPLRSGAVDRRCCQVALACRLMVGAGGRTASFELVGRTW
jgi:hypothetical protein